MSRGKILFLSESCPKEIFFYPLIKMYCGLLNSFCLDWIPYNGSFSSNRNEASEGTGGETQRDTEKMKESGWVLEP